MIVSQILHPKLSPNLLSMVVVALTNSGQAEFAVECFDWGKLFFFKLIPIVHVLIRINSLTEQQSELFVHMTDSEIIENWIDH